MKKTIVLILLTLAMWSCEKDNPGLIDDIPDWLRTQISVLEQEIKADPSSLIAYTAWVRYKWKKEYYFEYINPPSSFGSLPVCSDGKNLDSAICDIYEKEKCCMKYVWKGPKY